MDIIRNFEEEVYDPKVLSLETLLSRAVVKGIVTRAGALALLLEVRS